MIFLYQMNHSKNQYFMIKKNKIFIEHFIYYILYNKY